MPKVNKNCSVGDVVRIEFDDHSEGSQHIVFEVFGRVLEKTRRSFVVGSWLYSDSQEIDENSCVWTILRAGIRSVQILKPSTEPCPTSNQTATKKSKSRQKPANSAALPPEAAKQGNADTILPELPASPESATTTGAASTPPTSI